MLTRLISLKCFGVIILVALLLGLPSFPTQAQIGRGAYVIPLAWSPDGSRVARVVGNEVWIIDATTKQRLFTLREHTDLVPMVAWSPDGTMIAASSFDQTTKIWNTISGTLLQTLEKQSDIILTVAWSPDGTRLVSSGFDVKPDLYVWDVQNWTLLSTHVIGTMIDAAFSPDGEQAVFVSPGLVEILTIQNFQQPVFPVEDDCCSSGIYSVAWNPDSSEFVTGSLNGLVTVWDANTSQMVKQFVANSHYAPDSRDVDNIALSWVRDVAFAPDGKSVRAVSGDGTIREWDAETGNLLRETKLAPLYTAAWSPDGEHLAIIAPTPEEAAVFDEGHEFDASQVTGQLEVITPFAS